MYSRANQRSALDVTGSHLCSPCPREVVPAVIRGGKAQEEEQEEQEALRPAWLWLGADVGEEVDEDRRLSCSQSGAGKGWG